MSASEACKWSDHLHASETQRSRRNCSKDFSCQTMRSSAPTLLLLFLSHAQTPSACALSLSSPLARPPAASPRRLVCAAAPPSEVRATCSRLAEGLFAGVQPAWREIQEASAAHNAQHGPLSGEHVHGTEPFQTRSVRVLEAAMCGDARGMHSLGSLSFFPCHLADLRALMPIATPCLQG